MEEHEKDDLEKKDKSDPRINYRDDWAEIHGSRKEAANEKSNQAKGEKIERIRDADGGKIKKLNDHLIEGEEQKGKTFAEQVGKKEPIYSRKPPSKDHLKSSTALTHPEEAKQNFKRATEPRTNVKSNSPMRGGGFRGGGAPQIDEPDEILKKKGKALNPEDILSMQKGEKPFEVALNEEKKPEIVNREQKTKPQQRFLEEPKERQKAAQEKLEQKQRVQSKSFKPAPPKDIFDTLPKKSKEASSKSFKPAPPKDIFDTLPKKSKEASSKSFKPTPSKDIFDKKASLQKTVNKVERPSPSKTLRSKPAKTNQIKR